MKRRVIRLVVVLLLGVAAFMVYRNMATLKLRGLPRSSSVQVATPARPGQVPVPAARPAAPPAAGATGAGQVPPPIAPSTAPSVAPPAGGSPGGPSSMATPPKAPGTPPVAGTSPAAGTAVPSGAPPAGAPSKAVPPGPAPQGAPAPGLPVPTNVASTAVNPNNEAALVGKGEQGRADPFSPLATQEGGGGPLPPLPSGQLPVPPGFVGGPGGPGTPPPLGVGMRVAGIMGGRSRVAIIEADGRTYVVRAGERVGEAVVVSVLPDRVVIQQNNVTFELSFGGA